MDELMLESYGARGVEVEIAVRDGVGIPIYGPDFEIELLGKKYASLKKLRPYFPLSFERFIEFSKPYRSNVWAYAVNRNGSWAVPKEAKCPSQ